MGGQMPTVYNGNSINILKAGDILIADASSTVSHCGLLVGERSGRADYVIHAKASGMVIEDPSQWGIKAQVFRGAGLTKVEARSIEEIARKIVETAQYGKSRAIFGSWSASSSYGTGARERLAKYRQRLTDHQGIVKNIYCSELVILSYQLGLGDENHRLFIKKDGKHTLPKTLRDYFRQNSDDWVEIGDYDA